MKGKVERMGVEREGRVRENREERGWSKGAS